MSKLLLEYKNKDIVCGFTPSNHVELTEYLDGTMYDLPRFVQRYLTNNAARDLFYMVANSPESCNKWKDFLRINLANEFGLGRGGALDNFAAGITRIACHDLYYYSWDPSAMRGGDLIKFKKALSILKRQCGSQGIRELGLDKNFNGMSFEDFMEFVNPIIEEYKRSENEELDRVQVFDTPTDYKVVKIPDMIEGGVAKPTPEGQRILDHLARYCDWCICTSEMEYAQYTQMGGKFYICLKDGFEHIEKPNVENGTDENGAVIDDYSAMDEYGLSMIAVIVDPEGYAEQVTTRWNHMHGGENHPDLWKASQLQKLLRIPFRQVFKPRDRQDLRQMHLNENKNKKSQHMGKKMMTESEIVNMVAKMTKQALSEMKSAKAKTETPKKKKSPLDEAIEKATKIAMNKIRNMK